ncbi:MAG: molybdopterin-dependent oxidoreductase [Proteobacteria bacterium]|nr:molybdopterin-dependent oxidoreductase [Pseudomonadota bacterium]
MSGWDRRTFLKTGAVGTGALALDNKRALLSSADKPWNAGTARSLRKFRDPAPTVCRMCSAHCGVVACRDGDRVVQVLGSTGAPNSQGGICARAFTGLERLYDAERQLYPLVRKGPRGAGQWERVSWERALQELGQRLEAARGQAVLHLGRTSCWWRISAKPSAGPRCWWTGRWPDAPAPHRESAGTVLRSWGPSPPAPARCSSSACAPWTGASSCPWPGTWSRRGSTAGRYTSSTASQDPRAAWRRGTR